jgi:hypothetical protein
MGLEELKEADPTADSDSKTKGIIFDPESDSISAAMRRLLRTPCPVDTLKREWREVLAEAAFEMAIDKPEAMRIILDRLEGRPAQIVSGPGGGPIKTQSELIVITKDDLKPALEALISCGAIQINPN